MTDRTPHLCPACGARVPCHGLGAGDLTALVSAAFLLGAIGGAVLTALLVLGTWTT